MTSETTKPVETTRMYYYYCINDSLQSNPLIQDNDWHLVGNLTDLPEMMEYPVNTYEGKYSSPPWGEFHESQIKLTRELEKILPCAHFTVTGFFAQPNGEVSNRWFKGKCLVGDHYSGFGVLSPYRAENSKKRAC